MTQFEEPAGAVDGDAATTADPAAAPAPNAAAGQVAEPVAEAAPVGERVAESAPEAAPVAEPEPAASPVAAALAELDTLPQRELAEHPEVYQRIHAELQSALATIDNA